MTFAIQNTEGKHLGFLLMVGDGKGGDCIFRSLPQDAELFESEETKLLYEMQLLGEFSYQIASHSMTFQHPRFPHEASMKSGVLKIAELEFKTQRVKKSK